MFSIRFKSECVVCFSVFAGGDAHDFFENVAEIVAVFVAAEAGYLGHGVLGLDQHVCSHFDAHVIEVLVKAEAGHLFELL